MDLGGGQRGDRLRQVPAVASAHVAPGIVGVGGGEAIDGAAKCVDEAGCWLRHSITIARHEENSDRGSDPDRGARARPAHAEAAVARPALDGRHR